MTIKGIEVRRDDFGHVYTTIRMRNENRFAEIVSWNHISKDTTVTLRDLNSGQWCEVHVIQKYHFVKVGDISEYIDNLWGKHLPTDNDSTDIIIDVFQIGGSDEWVMRAYEPSSIRGIHSMIRYFDNRCYGSIATRRADTIPEGLNMSQRVAMVSKHYEGVRATAMKAIRDKYPQIEAEFDYEWIDGDLYITDFDPDKATQQQGRVMIITPESTTQSRRVRPIELYGDIDGFDFDGGYQIWYQKAGIGGLHRVLRVIYDTTKGKTPYVINQMIRSFTVDGIGFFIPQNARYDHVDQHHCVTLSSSDTAWLVEYQGTDIGVIIQRQDTADGEYLWHNDREMNKFYTNDYADLHSLTALMAFQHDSRNSTEIRDTWYCGLITGQSDILIECKVRSRTGTCKCSEIG